MVLACYRKARGRVPKGGELVYDGTERGPMASRLREIVLHAVVGFPRDFRPRAIFMPDILLGVKPICRASLNQILPHPNEWGGWPARAFEVLCRLDSARAHVLLTVPIGESGPGASATGWRFIHPLKRDLVETRTRLLEFGAREITTCSLMVREELIARLADGESEGERERLETLGFRRRFAFSDLGEGSPPDPFEPLAPPSSDEGRLEEWAGRLIGSCVDRESV